MLEQVLLLLQVKLCVLFRKRFFYILFNNTLLFIYLFILDKQIQIVMTLIIINEINIIKFFVCFHGIGISINTKLGFWVGKGNKTVSPTWFVYFTQEVEGTILLNLVQVSHMKNVISTQGR